MTQIDWVFATLLVAAIYGAVRYRESNIRLENDKKLLTDQVGELAGKIAYLAEDNTEAMKSITKDCEAKINQKDKQIESLHKEFEEYAKRDRAWSRIVESRDTEIAAMKSGTTSV